MKSLHALDYVDYELGLYLPGEDSDSAGEQTEPKDLSVKTREPNDSHLMRAEKDENGEMVATETLDAASVTARFRNKAEHFGYVDLEFDIIVPGDLIMDDFRIDVHPYLSYLGDTVALNNYYVTGKSFRESMKKGEEKFNDYAGKIVSDTTSFLRSKQFAKFLQRNLPEIDSQKGSDLSVLGNETKTYFDVTCMDAYDNYLNKTKLKVNNKKKFLLNSKKEKYCPYDSEGVLFDTLGTYGEDFIYRYTYSLKTRPKMKKIDAFVSAYIINYDDDLFLECKDSKPLSFYVSSISVLAEDIERRLRNGELDQNYAEGLQALKDMDYEKAGKILRRYRDYNAALAMVSVDNNYTAEDILSGLKETAATDYLLAIVYKRMGHEEKAVSSYLEACRKDKKFINRGNLDAEISSLKKQHNLDAVLESYESSTEL